MFIRHAQSNFNKGGFDYVDKNGLHHMDWLELVQDDSFNQAVTYNPIYIDPHITEFGVQQVALIPYCLVSCRQKPIQRKIN